MLRLPLPNDDFESRPSPCSPNEDVGSVNKKMKCGFSKDCSKDVSTQFGTRTFEKSVEKPDFFICSSFQNLRLGSIGF